LIAQGETKKMADYAVQVFDMSSDEPQVALHCYICGFTLQIKVRDREEMNKEIAETMVGIRTEEGDIEICKKHIGRIDLYIEQ
jgi:hypothetical protein